jgi:hypothetical protein
MVSTADAKATTVAWRRCGVSKSGDKRAGYQSVAEGAPVVSAGAGGKAACGRDSDRTVVRRRQG